jgi:alpha-galactosidase
MKSRITRRNLLRDIAVPSAAALLIPQNTWSENTKTHSRGASPRGFDLPVLGQPDLMFAFVGNAEPERYRFTREGEYWAKSGINNTGESTRLRVKFVCGERQARILLDAPDVPVQRIHLRWKCHLPEGTLALGDAWERSYGDLEWKPLQAERAMPWYAMLHSGEQTSGVGVMTGAASFAFWQADSIGISLWLDVRNGGNGVKLGSRVLEMEGSGKAWQHVIEHDLRQQRLVLRLRSEHA